jgi:hypothetical protein
VIWENENENRLYRKSYKISKTIKELSDLLHIPEVEAIISKTLEEIKERYAEKIEEYWNSKQNIEKQIGERLSKDKSYFFEANKVVDENSESKWVLVNLKLEADKATVNMIFSEFLEELDKTETNPRGFQKKTIIPTSQKKVFEIYFIKGSESHVSGFIKILEEDFIVRNNANMVTLNNHASENLEKEALIRLMDENDEFSKDIFFTLRLMGIATNPESD